MSFKNHWKEELGAAGLGLYLVGTPVDAPQADATLLKQCSQEQFICRQGTPQWTVSDGTARSPSSRANIRQEAETFWVKISSR